MAKNKLVITLALLMLGGCATSTHLNIQSGEEGPAWLVDTNLSTDISDDLPVNHGLSSKAVYYIKKKSGKWSMADAEDKGTELIVVDYDQMQIRLAAKGVKVPSNKRYRRFKCGTFLYIPQGTDECKSDFAMASFVGDQVLATIIMLPFELLFGYFSVDKVVDTVSLTSAIEESGLLVAIDGEHTRRWMVSYEQSFNSLSSAAEASNFINKYAQNDPKGLVPLAESVRDRFLSVDRDRRLAAEAERARYRAEQEALAKKRAREENLRVDHAMKSASKYRTTVRVGTETNCGPVLEIRGELIKVFSPVMNYGNEHWIPLSKLFPPGYGCQFYNGRYSEPSY